MVIDSRNERKWNLVVIGFVRVYCQVDRRNFNGSERWFERPKEAENQEVLKKYRRSDFDAFKKQSTRIWEIYTYINETAIDQASFLRGTIIFLTKIVIINIDGRKVTGN